MRRSICFPFWETFRSLKNVDHISINILKIILENFALSIVLKSFDVNSGDGVLWHRSSINQGILVPTENDFGEVSL